MKARHWSLVIVGLLVLYLMFSSAFTYVARKHQPGGQATRTPQPTYESVNLTPVTWLVLPTSTPHTVQVLFLPTATAVPTMSMAVTATIPAGTTGELAVVVTDTVPAPLPTTETPAPTSTLPAEAPTPESVAAAPTAGPTVHVVRQGEYLKLIAAQYGVTIQAIVRANRLANPDLIYPGQKLVIPVGPSQPPAPVGPTQTSAPQPPSPTRTSGPKPARSPTATKPPSPAPTATPNRPQFTGELIWDPNVAPNCAGPGISQASMVRDAAGNPVNGVVIRVECFGNRYELNPSGTAGLNEPGHYDWGPGQSSPQDWTCTAQVVRINGQPVSSSQVISIHFDTNDCKPGGKGHQVAILHWTKWW